MAMYLTSPDKHVIGRCEIKIEEPSIQRVYWTNEAGEEIDKLIPQSKAILRIETRAWNPKIKLEIELTHKSGEPITTKAKDIKEVSVNKEGIATQQYKWSIEDTIVATVKSVDDKNSKGAVQKQAIDLVKEWGIWIDTKDKSDMYFFNPQKPDPRMKQFITSVYEAYLHFKKVNHTKVFDAFIGKNMHDVIVRNEKGANANTTDRYSGFDVFLKKHQLVTTIGWHERKGTLTKNQNGEIVAQSPATVLLHEFGHAYYIQELGLKENKRLDSVPPNDPNFKVSLGNGYRLDEMIVENFENPAAHAVGDGRRDVYKSQTCDVKSTTERPDVKLYSKW